MSETKETHHAGGLGGSLRRFGDSIFGLFETRMEIFSLEWAEERRNLTRLLIMVFAIAVCLQLALIMGVIFLVLVVGQEHRVTVLGVASLVLLLAVLIGGLWLRAWLKRRPPMFAVTIAEIRKDREWIRGRS